MQRTLSVQVANNVGKKVTLMGWVATRRDHGKIIFIDLRDRTGITQVIFVPNGKTYEQAQQIRPEWVVEVTGEIGKRPKGMENANIPSGSIELKASELTVLSEAQTPPFELDETNKVDEAVRMQYRYLDLRTKRMQENITARHRALQFIRNYLVKNDFLEIETPILTKSTPEGARDYVVPSRLQPGNFYALPQSPQQYKQLLMVSGFERYFQIPRCFRDEDTRGDRQPEFTQIDLEVSFAGQEEIMALAEKMMILLVNEHYPKKKITVTPFPKITHAQGVKLYQSDRPDLRKDKKNPDELAFAWIVDFPMFEKREDKSIGAVHHPFTKPQSQSLAMDTKAFQYDLVCNGFELGGGSIRNSNPDLLRKVFEFMGHSRDEINRQFGHLLKAFEYGVPPHGGIALGLDRIMAILRSESSIREVIAFPKTGDGRDLMMGAPSPISAKQLKELKLKNG
ncbi:MAG: aspartate--tRNA ligase [Patescibacteria group bacterium]